MGTDEQLAHEASTTLIAAKDLSGAIGRTPEELANIVSQFAWSEGWMDRVRLRAEGHWYERVYHGPDHDIWVITWLPGQTAVALIGLRTTNPELLRPYQVWGYPWTR